MKKNLTTEEQLALYHKNQWQMTIAVWILLLTALVQLGMTIQIYMQSKP